MKSETLNLRISPAIKRGLKIWSENDRISLNELVERILAERLEGQEIDLVAEATGSIELICRQIEKFEAVRDYSRDLNEAERQFLEILNFCYEIMARSTLLLENKENFVDDPCPETEEIGKVYRFGTTNDNLADEVIKKL